MHIRVLSSDRVTCLNPIELFREATGLGLAHEEYSGRLFGNGANINGVLETPQAMSDEALSRFRTLWQQNYGGVGNAGKIAILEQGMKWQAIGIAPKDAGFIISRKFQITEIARIFRVPPHMLAGLERATCSNIEHQSLEFFSAERCEVSIFGLRMKKLAGMSNHSCQSNPVCTQVGMTIVAVPAICGCFSWTTKESNALNDPSAGPLANDRSSCVNTVKSTV